jgi:predicted transcriptional regulator
MKTSPEFEPTDIYGDEKVLTIKDLKMRMMVSEITIRRKLKKWGAITSYNKNGRYYTLIHIPKFDSWGLWNYTDIRFSKYGNLTQTIIQLINHSSSGLHAEEVGDLIDYTPHSLLHRLAGKAAIRREKLYGKYVYFSCDEQEYKAQLNKYQSIQAQYQDDMPCLVAIRLLIEKIKRPKDSIAQLVGQLQKDNVKISEVQATRFLEKHGIEKKTPDLK